MKMVKRLFTVLMSFLMVLVLAMPALAEGDTLTGTGEGSITINNATVGESYTIYQIFTTDSTGKGNVTATAAQKAFYEAFTGESEGLENPFTFTQNPGKQDFTVTVKEGVTDQQVITFLQSFVRNVPTGDGDSATTEVQVNTAFAEVAPYKTVTAERSTVEFTEIPYGYYLVSSSLGAVVTLDSTAPNVTIQDKNQTPGPDPEDGKYKQIVDQNGTAIAGESTVNYGDTVYYVLKAKATNYDGDKQIISYTAHDVLGQGLKDLTVSKVEVINSDTNVSTELAENTNYTVTTSPADGCTADITITWATKNQGTETYTSSYNANSLIKIYCQATVKDNAEVGRQSNITNKGWFTWAKAGDTTPGGGESTSTTVTSYTYAIGVIKTDKKGTALENAKFSIKDKDGTAIKVTKISNGVYKYDPTSSNTEVVSNSDGKIIVKGLAASGTYTLTETEAPAGYNKLESAVDVTAAEMTASTTKTTIYKNADGDIVSKEESTTSTEYTFDFPVAAINVINEAGAQLPSTGGMGTMLFYVIGAILVVAAGVLLVTKRRMKDDK